jgi:hypothetical protein
VLFARFYRDRLDVAEAACDRRTDLVHLQPPSGGAFAVQARESAVRRNALSRPGAVAHIRDRRPLDIAAPDPALRIRSERRIWVHGHLLSLHARSLEASSLP